MIDVAGRESQFREHLWPVYRALPDEIRGRWHGGQLDRSPLRAEVTLVASWGDYKRVQGRVLFLEHGVGTNYGDHPSFPGGSGKDRVELFLNANHLSSAHNERTYPKAKHAVIGAPKMDEWAGYRHVPNDPPVVALAFAERNNGVPEGKSAHPHYTKALRELVRNAPVRFIGHGHPRSWAKWSRFWKMIRVEPVQDFREVLQRADVYCVDASSTAYEFASTGRPVVSLNAPWYRRDVHHGVRFWQYVPGIQVDDPAHLPGAIMRALAGEGEDLRREAVDAVHPIRDGTATKRAVKAILEVL